MPSLKDQLRAIDENYLLSIANKGLLNRAQKELANTEIAIAISDSTLEATLKDGTTVTITNTPGNFTCSCPARTICKHVVMALLYVVQDNAAVPLSDEDGDKPGELALPSFAYLLEYTQEALIKEYGKKLYDDALSKALNSQPSIIDESQKLTISMVETAVTVSFLPGDRLGGSICTCKAKECHHRLEALFHYIQYKTGELRFSLTSTEATVDMSIIPHALSLVEDIYRIGLFRLPPDFSEKCSQYSTLCHGAGFAALERLFETCGRELALYEQKNAAFNINSLSKCLGAIYQICSAVAGGKSAAALAGRFKRQYLGLPKIRIMGIGAYPWYATSGFCGVTAIFYCPDLKRPLTFALSRPVDSEQQGLKTINQFWNDKSAWNLHISFDELAKGEYSLTSAKISDNDRLSSSEGTKGALISAPTELDSEELAGIVFEDFSQIKQLFSQEDDFNSVYAILKPARIEEGHFNRVTQEYKMPIFDKNDNCLYLTVRYSKINESVLHYCETLAQKNVPPNAITVSLAISQERFNVLITPIAFWAGSTVQNLGKDLPAAKDKKRQSYFAKFFNTKP